MSQHLYTLMYMSVYKFTVCINFDNTNTFLGSNTVLFDYVLCIPLSSILDVFETYIIKRLI